MESKIWKPALIISAIVLLIILFRKRATAAINYYSNGWSSPTSIFQIRGCANGCGYYGAPRGDDTHHGLDIVATPGEPIFSPINGEVSSFPYPYASDLSYTGIQITGSGVHQGFVIRIFYISANVSIQEQVYSGQEIGIAQDIASKYGGGMENHIHLEVKQNGIQKDPETYYSLLV